MVRKLWVQRIYQLLEEKIFPEILPSVVAWENIISFVSAKNSRIDYSSMKAWNFEIATDINKCRKKSKVNVCTKI